jgi:hypothetical protein
MRLALVLLMATTLVSECLPAGGQAAPLPSDAGQAKLTVRGQILVGGQSMPYLIRHLPVSSFPELPQRVAEALNRKGCVIPQTYEAHGPENVVHASLQRPGSTDWAVLCSEGGMVSLLVFFGSEDSAGQSQPVVLASAPETERLHPHPVTGVLGFNWGIDVATPEQVHQAQAGMDKRPARIDHDALADSLLDRRTVYHFYARGAWVALAMPE